MHAALFFVGAIACGSVGDELLTGKPYFGGVIDGGEYGPPEEGTNVSGRGAGSGAPTGLPCDVQQVIENQCIACHLGTTSAPALLTYEDLVKPSPADAKKSVAQRCVDRMNDATSPMPPAPAAPSSAADIQTITRWIAAGLPRGETCGDPNAADAGANPFATPTVCSSARYWRDAEEGSSRMKPGNACIACHTLRGKKRFTIAGTVYPTAHEPNDCEGVAGGAIVEVTGSDGRVASLTVNAAGNFSSESAVAAPFRVKVKSGGKERVMVGALTSGDCNSCHTVAGANGAPGRIVAP